jgi:GMP synthase (glutamine-hydrolysing)
MQQVLMVVHQETSNPGLIGKVIQAKGYELDIRCPSVGHSLPDTLAQHEAVVIFGGPMSANDHETLPFIKQELEWIPKVLATGKPYLGICLGAQLLARSLGASVQPHAHKLREIGYFPITPTPAGRCFFPVPMHVYQWHGEGFTLPKGATLLAKGELFPNQAFRHGAAYGVQFHPEMTKDMMEEWMSRAADQLSLPGAQSYKEQHQNHEQYGKTVAIWLEEFVQHWLGAQERQQNFSAA